MQVSLYCVVCCVVVLAGLPSGSCTVHMRQEECIKNATSKCAPGEANQVEAGVSHQRMSVLGVEEPDVPQSSHYTPLPFAAFMAPRPVYQASVETVFNVLEQERTVERLLKGGKRQVDREIKEESSLDDSENSSRSNVQFRRRKGGKRSDRKRQLRKERIERKRARRKNRRKNRQEKKKLNKHPKHRKGRTGKVKSGRLKSLNNRNRRRNREEQIGSNLTQLIKGGQASPAAPGELRSLPRPETGAHEMFPADQGTAAVDTEVFLESSGTATATSEVRNPYIDVHNYNPATSHMEDYDDEDDDEDDLLTDVEYGTRQVDDYQIGPDYFNWNDNSSMDYFTQGDETTASPESWPVDAALELLQLDPSHIQVRRHLVRLHNLLRSKVDPPAANMLALSWHGAAATQARRWAESCVEHRGRDHPSVRWTPRYGACGQNVLVTRRKRRWAQVIRSWWSERRLFQYGSTDLRNATYRSRSYTQLVWYSSHKVGCGYAQCTTTAGNTFHRYVCNYCPAGNDPSRLSVPYITGRPCEMCPRACRSVCPEGQCRLCTNRCQFSDLWANCDTLAQRWRQWLCNTKTQPGVERFKNCRATCQCALAGDKII